MRDNECDLGEKQGIMIKIVIWGKGKKLKLRVLVSEMFGGLRGGTELVSSVSYVLFEMEKFCLRTSWRKLSHSH